MTKKFDRSKNPENRAALITKNTPKLRFAVQRGFFQERLLDIQSLLVVPQIATCVFINSFKLVRGVNLVVSSCHFFVVMCGEGVVHSTSYEETRFLKNIKF